MTGTLHRSLQRLDTLLQKAAAKWISRSIWLCPCRDAKLARRAHFTPDAGLIRHGLLSLIADTNQIQPPLLAHSLKPYGRRGSWQAGNAAVSESLNDFRIHQDSTARTEADALGATAFTRGREMSLASEAPLMVSVKGRELIEHEMAHVVQQREALTLDDRSMNQPGDATTSMVPGPPTSTRPMTAGHTPVRPAPNDRGPLG